MTLEPSAGTITSILRRPLSRHISRHRVDHKVGGVVVIHHFPGYEKRRRDCAKFAANLVTTPSVSPLTIGNLRRGFERRGGRRASHGGSAGAINWSVTSASAAKYLRALRQSE